MKPILHDKSGSTIKSIIFQVKHHLDNGTVYMKESKLFIIFSLLLFVTQSVSAQNSTLQINTISPTLKRLVAGPLAAKPGFSIYTFTTDPDVYSTCYNGCAQSWPPVLISSVEALVLPINREGFIEEFSVSARCDGTLQLNYNGHPLYYYSGDTQAGQTNGKGAGNVWWLIEKTTQPIASCTDNIKNGAETGIDCGGNCPNACSAIVSPGTCGNYGLTIVDGKGVLYYSDKIGTASYFCTGGGFNGCYPPTRHTNGYYQRDFDVTIGQSYSLAIQASPSNVEFTVVAGADRCYFVATCTDGVKNANETGIDCGGPICSPCPTCTDGIKNGRETDRDCGGPDCQSCATICNGTPNPNATVTKQDESFENKKDGKIIFTFPNTAGRNAIAFSITDGTTYLTAVPDNQGSYTLNNIAPGTYKLMTRWEDNSCPIKLGSITILEGGPPPTCSDGIMNQNETRVDCGGVCTACTADPCGDIPKATYLAPALATPITGKPAKQHGWSFDLSTDLKKVSVRASAPVLAHMGNNTGSFEFFCSCNQVEFSSVLLGDDNVADVPQKCIDAGNYFYFFRYKKAGNTTKDAGDIYQYSGLFTTQGPRIDPDTRGIIVSKSANWFRYRHPHPQDGITEAIHDAMHNQSKIKQLDRYETIVTDGPDNIRFEPFLHDSKGGHPNKDQARIPLRRLEFLENGGSSPPSYAANLSPGGDTRDMYPYSDVSGLNYGNIITYELTAVTVDWPGGAQNYNTLQNYVAGQGFNTFGDPRLAMAGKASTNMVISGFGSNVKMEENAIFTQHLITLQTEDEVDDFLEGHHLFHGIAHNRAQVEPILGEIKIGKFACGDCHFRDGRGTEPIATAKGIRLPPPVYGSGLLQWIAGAQVGLTWDGSVPTVDQQTRNALIEDHGINPNTDISPKDLERLIAYTKFLTVPTRSKAAYDDPDIIKGHQLFYQIGCQSCHSETQKTRTDAPPEFRDLVIRPFTDMKTHNVYKGTYRTAPLWGLGRNMDLLTNNGKTILFMHDGAITSLPDAITAHGGEAAASRAAYIALPVAEQMKIIKFLKSL